MRTSHRSGTESATPASPSRPPWRTALAGLLLLATSGGLMAYGAPSHASTRAPNPRETTLASASSPRPAPPSRPIASQMNPGFHFVLPG
jgi:hypothetical protein